MRCFKVYRECVPDETHDSNMKNPSNEVQFEGVIFEDGTVAIRWLTVSKSTAIWNSFDDLMKIHGHPEYGTKVVFDDVISDDEVPEGTIPKGAMFLISSGEYDDYSSIGPFLALETFNATEIVNRHLEEAGKTNMYWLIEWMEENKMVRDIEHIDWELRERRGKFTSYLNRPDSIVRFDYKVFEGEGE